MKITDRRRFYMALRAYSAFAKGSLKIGLLPADGIGREVLPVIIVMLDLNSLLCLLTLNSRLPVMLY